MEESHGSLRKETPGSEQGRDEVIEGCLDCRMIGHGWNGAIAFYSQPTQID
jgi:hypothetical protein